MVKIFPVATLARSVYLICDYGYSTSTYDITTEISAGY